jgi:hypothetical protein
MQMMRVFTILAAGMVLAGCMTTKPLPLKMMSVESSGSAQNEVERIEITDQDSGADCRYEDDLLLIRWTPGIASVDFQLTNKTRRSMKVLWDDCSYVDEAGNMHRVMRGGTNYYRRDQSFPPTTIVGKGTLTERVLPTDLSTFLNGLGTQVVLTDKDAVGKSVKVLMVLEQMEDRHEYLFEFKVLPKG